MPSEDPTQHDGTSDEPLRGELVPRPGDVERPPRPVVRRGRPPAVRIRETEPTSSGAVVRRVVRATPTPRGRVAMRRTFVNRITIAEQALGADHALSRLLHAIAHLRDTNEVTGDLVDLLVTIRGLFDDDGRRTIDTLDIGSELGDLQPARRRQVERVLLRLAEELETRHGLVP